MAQISRERRTDQTSPERTKIWTEPKNPNTIRKVPVVYYLCRNGLLEHPHFIEVPLSSPNGLYLKDFINRLNFVRGKGMAIMYAWSSKRSYKNGFVWQDLFENDFIYPSHGQEYVLKGSELLEPPPNLRSQEMPKLSNGEDLSAGSASCDSIDLNDYKVYKAESTAEIAGKAADASTQTEDQTPRRRRLEKEEDEIPTTELSREEISPPPSSSSSETPESTIKDTIDGSIGVEGARIIDQTAGNHPSGRIRASAVLKQLISCGSMSVREEHGLSMISRLPHGGPQNQVVSRDSCFSGSMIDGKKDEECVRELLDLKRSSSSAR